jgi:hypothetical protein
MEIMKQVIAAGQLGQNKRETSAVIALRHN